ncbi:MAG: hydrogenase formation protein HypD, partial [Endomicrobiales bacterium]
ALRALLDIKERRIDGFLLPGHVSTIIGSRPYEFIAQEFKIPGVIGGFEPDDVLASVRMLLAQVRSGQPKIEIQYSRSVKPDGNKTAKSVLRRVFKETDSSWRAIGVIPKSGMTFNDTFRKFDAGLRFDLRVPEPEEPKGCQCGAILLGLKTPAQCPHFARKCTPADPVGPCMVSSEGSCAAEYKYGRGKG